jgi:hypothetical protein
VRASGEAQGLAYASKHLGLDPYRLWNIGIDPLPPHPRPRVYRHLLYAMGYWLEDQERSKFALVAEAGGAKVDLHSLLDQLGTVKGH